MTAQHSDLLPSAVLSSYAGKSWKQQNIYFYFLLDSKEWNDVMFRPVNYRSWSYQGSKFHSSDRLKQVKMTVGQVEYLQDLSDGLLCISDFHTSWMGFIYFRQVNGTFGQVVFTIHLPDGQVQSIWNFEACMQVTVCCRAGASTRFTSTSTSMSTCNMCEYEYESEYLIIAWVRVQVWVLVDEYEYEYKYRHMIYILYKEQYSIFQSLKRESSDSYKPETKL